MIKKSLCMLLLFIFVFCLSVNVYSTDNAVDQVKSDLTKKIDEYQSKITEISKEKDTLANQLKFLDFQVNLTELKINQTESAIKSLELEIGDLTSKINDLDINLNKLSSLYLKQIVQNYKLDKRTPKFSIFTTNSFNGFLDQYKYVSTIQKNSQDTLMKLETARTSFDIQKEEKKRKQLELEDLERRLDTQKNDLVNQTEAKKKLLEQTKNDEKKYQNLLSNARSELTAMMDIFAGKGIETKGGEVKEGDVIASVISGSSCSSSGTHLHFSVRKSGNDQNPFNYLKSVDYINSSGGDVFNPSGSWNWPLSGRIVFNQGYGATWAIKNTWVSKIYSFHNGIDIASSSNDVHSTIDGSLYRGSILIKSQGCYLRYIKVVGKDGVSTLGLHVNY